MEESVWIVEVEPHDQYQAQRPYEMRGMPSVGH